MTDPRRQSSHHRARSVGNAARSRRLWTMRLCTFTRRSHLRIQNNKKSVTLCTVTKDVETSRPNSYICPYSFTPLASKALIPQRCGRDYTKETGISSSIRLRGVVMARNRKGHPYCDVTTIRQTRHFRFWRRQISRWRRRWYRQTGRGGAKRLLFLLSFNVCTCAGVYCLHVHA